MNAGEQKTATATTKTGNRLSEGADRNERYWTARKKQQDGGETGLRWTWKLGSASARQGSVFLRSQNRRGKRIPQGRRIKVELTRKENAFLDGSMRTWERNRKSSNLGEKRVRNTKREQYLSEIRARKGAFESGRNNFPNLSLVRKQSKTKGGGCTAMEQRSIPYL